MAIIYPEPPGPPLTLRQQIGLWLVVVASIAAPFGVAMLP